MTTADAIHALIETDPTRGYCADKELFAHRQAVGHNIVCRYKIAVLPGFDGQACSQFIAESFDAALAQAKAALSPQPATSNEE